MKKFVHVRRIWQWAAAIAVCMSVLFVVQPVSAADVEIYPGSSIETAPLVGYNQDYFGKKRAAEEYIAFTTPAGHWYYRIVLSNISVGDFHGNIITANGRVVGGNQNPWRANKSVSWVLDLEAGQTYYIHTWGGTVGGNYGVYLQGYPDNEGTSKYDAVPINVNQEYVWSKEVNADEDYGVFTAPVTGNYRMTFTNIQGGDLYIEIHEYSSDRQKGKPINIWRTNASYYSDYALEQGVRYYVKITGSHDNEQKKYSFLISNQNVTAIQLNPSSLKMDRGTGYDLTATVLPANAANKDVSWSTSNDSVVSVNNRGHIYAEGVGTAVITCTAEDGSGVKGTCTVSVKPPKMYKPWVASYSTGSIRLKWDKISGAKGYTIYRCDPKTKKWKALKSLKQNYYVVKKLKKGTSYKFRVAAYVTKGSSKIYGQKSDTLTAATAPGKTSFSIKQGRKYGYYYRYRYVTLRAKKAKNASGYQFAYAYSRYGTYYTLNTGSRSYRTAFQTGKLVYFKVRAYKKAGNDYYYGAWSKPKKSRIRK